MAGHKYNALTQQLDLTETARVNALENITFKIAYYEEITTTSGQITIPTNSTIILDQWANGVDAVLSAIPGGAGTKPDYEDTGVDVTTFDISGNYVLSGALPSTPSALIYYIAISLKDFSNLDREYIIEYAELTSPTGLINPVDYISFNTAFGGGITDVGAIQWNDADNTLDVNLPNNVVGQMFQETFFDVINQSGSTITDGTPVMFGGTTGASGKIKIVPAIADNSIPPEYTVGIVTESIDNGEEGKVTWFGKVRGINTSGTPYGETWNDGDILYVSPTTAGYLTNVKPSAPNQIINVAAVINTHATNGTIIIRPTWAESLNRLSDVNGTTLNTDKQLMVWDNVNKYHDFTEVYGEFGDKTGGNYATFNENGELRLYGDATQWEDLRFPLVGRNLDSQAGRIDANYFNGGLDFATNARYPQEPISMLVQLPHARLATSNIDLHLHWLQQSTDEPNWLVAYKVMSLNTIVNKETDYSNHTLVTKSNNVFTYTSGNLNQITEFGDIDGSTLGISDMIHIVLFRDSANTSTLFTGTDGAAGLAFALEFDCHIQLDSLGSNEEYVKY